MAGCRWFILPSIAGLEGRVALVLPGGDFVDAVERAQTTGPVGEEQRWCSSATTPGPPLRGPAGAGARRVSGFRPSSPSRGDAALAGGLIGSVACAVGSRAGPAASAAFPLAAEHAQAVDPADRVAERVQLGGRPAGAMRLERVVVVLLLRHEAVRREHDDAAAGHLLHLAEQPAAVLDRQVLEQVEGDHGVERVGAELVRDPHDVEAPVVVMRAGGPARLQRRLVQVDADHVRWPPLEAADPLPRSRCRGASRRRRWPARGAAGRLAA